MYLPNVILYQYNNDLNNRDQTGGGEFAANFSYICLINHNYIYSNAYWPIKLNTCNLFL